MTTPPPATNGPWAQSCSEEQADLAALERALEMSPEQRQVALAVLNSKRRQAHYQGEANPAPLALPDGWGPPRWHQADAATGGPEPQPPATLRLATGTLLAHVAPGSCLDPVPRRQKRQRQPLLRCDRCGCFAPAGWSERHCPTCCNGSHPIPTTEASGLAPPAQ